MKEFQKATENNLKTPDATICGGVMGGRKAWILPGGHITHSREVAEKALRFIGRVSRGVV